MARQLQGPGMGLRALGEELLSAFAAGEEKYVRRAVSVAVVVGLRVVLIWWIS